MTTTAPRNRRLFAVIPAAGHSRRMGRPKLLLPVEGVPVIARLLSALEHPVLAGCVVVVRRSDSDLQQAVRAAGGNPVSPDLDPPDMRASVEYGLQQIQELWQPEKSDGWLMLPGDYPCLNRETVQRLVTTWLERQPRFLVPLHDGKRGHPLLAQWETVAELKSLPPDLGLNHLLKLNADEILEVPINHRGVLTDIDVPADYAAVIESTKGPPQTHSE